MFLLVPAHPGSPRPRAVKWLLMLFHSTSVKAVESNVTNSSSNNLPQSAAIAANFIKR